MLLQEVYQSYCNHQVVLSLSNNNDVLITEDSFNPESKFFRTSKVRLGVDFVMSGILSGESFIATNDQTLTKDATAIIYRTYREDAKNDYVLYIYQGEYKLLEGLKKKLSRKRVIMQTQQLTLNSITKPMPDKVLHICPHIENMQYWVSYKNKALATERGEYLSNVYTHSMPHSYLGYYAAVLLGLSVAKKYADRIDEVRVFYPEEDYYSYGVCMFPLKKWRPKNPYTRDYMNKIDVLRRELSELGISIRFVTHEENKNREKR